MFSKCLLLLFCLVFTEGQYYDHKCPQPHLSNGRVRIRQRSKLVKFICMPRYELVGNRYATCKDGSWDSPTPVCVKPGCIGFSVQNAVQISAHHDAWVTTFCLPGYTLVGSPAVYCNGYKWNTTAPKCIEGNSATQLSCDFESADLCGWMQDDLHDFDWIRLNSKTPTSFLNTGPQYDHTLGKGGKGYYMYIESTSKIENSTARLLSPVFDSKYALDGCFSFFYHMFGKGIGGLRVYQKPDGVQISDLLESSDAIKQQYVLFEQWGNQGDFWFSAAPQLKDFKDSFQIVIEGVRGWSFTSDIAIDDVALLQGTNCTYFRNAATTPVPPSAAESCAGRCDDQLPVPNGCECSATCFEKERCCADYLEICVFNGINTTDDDTTPMVWQSTDARTTEYTTTSTTAAPTTIPTTATTESTPTMTTDPTTKATKATTASTTITAATATVKITTITTIATTKLSSTTRQTVPTNITVKPTTAISSTILTTTILSTSDTQKGDKESKIQKVTIDKAVDIPRKSTAWKTAVITIVVLAVLASLVYVALVSRTNRGRVAIARLRGQTLTTNDSEVQYLNSNDDDL